MCEKTQPRPHPGFGRSITGLEVSLILFLPPRALQRSD